MIISWLNVFNDAYEWNPLFSSNGKKFLRTCPRILALRSGHLTLQEHIPNWEVKNKDEVSCVKRKTEGIITRWLKGKKGTSHHAAEEGIENKIVNIHYHSLSYGRKVRE